LHDDGVDLSELNEIGGEAMGEGSGVLQIDALTGFRGFVVGPVGRG
jgi:hypothetical protein